MRTDWPKFQTHMDSEIPFNPEFHNSMDIDTCVENFSGAILGVLEASTPKRRPIGDPCPQVPAGIQDEVRLRAGCGDAGRSPGTPL